MRKVKLTHNHMALVDDKDYARVMLYKWQARLCPKTVYATRSFYEGGKKSTVQLHRFILSVTDPKVHVDHKDHNGLNCQRYNLRKANNAKNQHNATLRRDNTSGYKGVSYRCNSGKWRAYICVAKQLIHIGWFTSSKEAALAYDKEARMYFGEFAHTNFKRRA